LRPFRPRPVLPALAVVLASFSLSFGCAPPDGSEQAEATPRLEGQRLSGAIPQEAIPQEATPQEENAGEAPEGETLSSSIPAEDALGAALPGLPRPPGSARTGYSREESDGLAMVRAAYLAREGPDAVRGFYRGVFREGGWQVANVEYAGDVWHILVLRGDLEAGVEVAPRDGGSKVEIELSGPAGGAQEPSASADGSKR
jgi:hypothetical protein